jgi:hypothetical protein
MSLYRQTADRNLESRSLTIALAALAALVATATVRSQNQANTTTQQTPVRTLTTTHPVQQQHVNPLQKPAVNNTQSAPNSGNTDQLHNVLNMLGSRNANANANANGNATSRARRVRTTPISCATP